MLAVQLAEREGRVQRKVFHLVEHLVRVLHVAQDALQGDEAASVREAITLLEARHVEALAVRQALSSQLRSLGISPKEEAEIWRELTRREAEEVAR